MGIPGSPNGVTLVPYISGHMAIFRFLKLPFWLVVWNMFFSFNIYIGNNDPNWLSYFSGDWNHQAAFIIDCFSSDVPYTPKWPTWFDRFRSNRPGANQLPRWVCHQNFATKFWWRLSQCSNNVVSFLVYGVIFVALKIILGYHNFAVLCVFLREHLISRQPHTYFPAISLSLERFFSCSLGARCFAWFLQVSLHSMSFYESAIHYHKRHNALEDVTCNKDHHEFLDLLMVVYFPDGIWICCFFFFFLRVPEANPRNRVVLSHR